ncbi:MAG TPA: hypothetical protein VFI70_11280 [Nitrososphaeraceae archaeon]|nr:hypothetical protein [Nitrososphaeraceae archaeon]
MELVEVIELHCLLNFSRKYSTDVVMDITSVQSYDFVRTKYVISSNDIVLVFSHRGTESFSIRALEFAKICGATTILITRIGSQNDNYRSIDFQIQS